MSEIEHLHEHAMDLAQDAFVAMRKGDADAGKHLLAGALALETLAASAFPAIPESEPTRSILYRSAATLAYKAQDYDQARQLIAFGLSGYPPIEIKEELEELNASICASRQGIRG